MKPIDEILSRIQPTSQERAAFTTVINSFLQKLNPSLQRIQAKAIVGGSGAKDTWLAGTADVDVFVVFDFKKYSTKSAELSDILHPVLKKAFAGKRIARLHGSRDYFQITYEKLEFEIIPLLKINKAAQAKNITDISPLHALWVNKHTKKLKKDIRLAKQFLKANKLYGAESYIGGVSGYVVEILIAYYGSFLKFLQAAARWKEKETIDVEKYYLKKDALFYLNKSKTQSLLIVIDPVDKNRNAAAALSEEKFLLLKKKAQEYLRAPSAHFFQLQKITVEALQQESSRENKNLIYVAVAPHAGKEDVVGVKLSKAFEFIREKLKPFVMVKSGWEWEGKVCFYFIVGKKQLPEFELRAGPPLALKSHVQDFKQKHKSTFVEKGRIMAKVKVPSRQINDYVNRLLKEKYVQERIKKILKVVIF